MGFCQVALRGAASSRRGVFGQAFVVLAIVVGSAALGKELVSEQISEEATIQGPVNPRKLMLPDWVQNTRGATLWPTSDGPEDEVTALPAHRVLRVFDAADGRLLVGVDAHEPTGWIDVSVIEPADAPAPWLQNHQITRGFVGAHGDATSGGVIPQFSYLRQVGPAEGDRIPVQVDPRVGDNPIIWVNAYAVGPVGTPPRVVFTGASSGWASIGKTTVSRPAFVDIVGAAARESQASSGVPASVTVAQAILESDWGQSSLSKLANNYFGIKGTGSAGSAGVIWMRTWEVIGGKDIFIQAPFRAYNSLNESIDDHANLFTRLRLYSGAMSVAKDPIAFARAIHQAGYSTDPSYVNKLVQLMDRHNLAQFDRG